MAHGDGSVFMQKQHGGGLAYKVAAAHHDRVFSGDGNAIAFQKFDDRQSLVSFISMKAYLDYSLQNAIAL